MECPRDICYCKCDNCKIEKNSDTHACFTCWSWAHLFWGAVVFSLSWLLVPAGWSFLLTFVFAVCFELCENVCCHKCTNDLICTKGDDRDHFWNSVVDVLCDMVGALIVWLTWCSISGACS